MAPIRIRPAADTQDQVLDALQRQTERLTRLLPTAEIEHVGATAVPGALTKGDLDILVRVQEDEFAPSLVVLEDEYTIHQPQNWTSTLASFIDPAEAHPEVGVQLVTAASADDALFAPFRDALIADPDLLRRYNALKQRLDGTDYATYTAVKGDFVEQVLRGMSATSERGLGSGA